MQKELLNEIKKEGASQVLDLDKIGSSIFKEKANSHDLWLVEGGWISKTKCEKLTGKRDERMHAIKGIQLAKKKACVLRSLTFYTDPNITSILVSSFL